ncbi:hypothetical protein Droror1_Dr00002874 [Drosera rotundifolia]
MISDHPSPLSHLKLGFHRSPNSHLNLGFIDHCNGEGSDSDEGGGVRAVAVPAEGDVGAVERSAREDPPQDHRELAQRYSSCGAGGRDVFLRAVVSGTGETPPSILTREVAYVLLSEP